jgi:hypothetical protein
VKGTPGKTKNTPTPEKATSGVQREPPDASARQAIPQFLCAAQISIEIKSSSSGKIGTKQRDSLTNFG